MVRVTPSVAYLWCIVSLCLLVLPSTTARAGTVIASTSAPPIAAALDRHGHRLRVFSATQEIITKNLSPPADTLYRSVRGKPLLVRGGAVWTVRIEGGKVRLVPTGTAPGGVNAAAAVGKGRWAFLAGGRWGDGELAGAGLYLSDTGGSGPLESSWVKAANCPQFLKAGYLGDERVLLVGVRTRAVFDSALRLRPWIFACDHGSIQPLWLGTSFSRPFVDAVFARCMPDEESQICVMELTRKGKRQIVAYTMQGRLMEGTAATTADRFGSRLRRVSPPGQDTDLVCTWLGSARGRIVALAGREDQQRSSGRLSILLQTDRMERPAGWDIAYSDGSLRAFVLNANGRLQVYGLKKQISDVGFYTQGNKW